ncbi:MAG: hypothetical protein A3J30_00265 [Candidatus Wildermuthbacteria bacterium RIFCSPLOWO2_02_FULL_47_9c]|uniref:PD-(D/E)XK endonuclease-like domain-containing protein n=1 Tax=Candidatus Wildermuthbacteria bacterium RIFCSPLOWO2_02_FULL_47_9c TaxID=1802466 RepID=A0A1G2RWV9_9BACT|nr:MAG: hypothetical protein A3J30_00265 [Candidatus Wildermuthbacteria bacterium RIFCSPLOWO2_02_FULL_47_9c]
MRIDLFKQKFGYEIEDMWLPRVTAITSIISKFPFALKNRRGFREHLEWGTEVHEFIGAMLQNPGLNNEKQDPRLIPIAESVASWQREYGVKLEDPKHDVERRVHNRELAYAGTIDLVAHVGDRKGLIEIKTGKQLVEEYFLQTAAYFNALVNSGASGHEYEARWILRIDQYEECEGCQARRKRRGYSSFVNGGVEQCNHQWSLPKADLEFLELPEYEQDLRAFFAAKELWEWNNRVHLRKIVNYPKHRAV